MSADAAQSFAGRLAARGRPVAIAPIVLARYVAVALVAVGLAATHLKHRPASLCVLRTFTGIPCPFCGGTTAAVDIGHGNLHGAVAASPLAVGLLGLGPLLSGLRMPAWWQVRRVRWSMILLGLAVSELWELHRFGIISF